MPKFTKKKKIAALTAALVIGVSGTAYAYWTMDGAGTGAATTVATTDPVVVHQALAAITGLYPDGPTPVLSGTLENTNDAAVTVGALTASVTDTGVGACLTTDYEIGGSATLSDTVVPGNTNSVTWTGLTVHMKNTALNQDACKGATIEITYDILAG